MSKAMDAAKLEVKRREQQPFTVPQYLPWDTGKSENRQLAKDARKRYAKRKRLTGRGRNMAVGFIALFVIVGMVAVSHYLHIAVQVAQQ